MEERALSRNPLRYRGYIYDTETGFYYLRSIYYDPQVGRFINADSQLNTDSLLGYNLFAYCENNPVNMSDNTGSFPCWNHVKYGFKKETDWLNNNIYQPVINFIKDIAEDFNKYDKYNESEEIVLESHYFSSYKGVLVIRTNGNRSGSFGVIFLTRESNDRDYPEDVVRHEYGHTKQLEQLGVIKFAYCIGLPSWLQWGTGNYYDKPWEITADIYGGVQSRDHSQSDIDAGFAYLKASEKISLFVWKFID